MDRRHDLGVQNRGPSSTQATTGENYEGRSKADWKSQMPLIFAESEETESGIEYSDQTGASYQFPRQYRNMIQPGERFVYYRGRKKHGGGRQPQIYFGAGIVGKIYTDADHGSRMRCEVLDYKAFPTPVFFKVGKHGYFEIGGSRKGYFQKGVRRVTEEEFERILVAAEVVAGLSPDVSQTDEASPGYTSGERLKAIEKYAVDAALKMLRGKFPGVPVIEQARNNPGFDILIKGNSGDSFVEVKGTSGGLPRFIITEGEVRFSERNAAHYSLIVVHSIDLVRQSHKTWVHEGAITEELFSKEPLQWRCCPLVC